MRDLLQTKITTLFCCPQCNRDAPHSSTFNYAFSNYLCIEAPRIKFSNTNNKMERTSLKVKHNKPLNIMQGNSFLSREVFLFLFLQYCSFDELIPIFLLANKYSSYLSVSILAITLVRYSSLHCIWPHSRLFMRSRVKLLRIFHSESIKDSSHNCIYISSSLLISFWLSLFQSQS